MPTSEPQQVTPEASEPAQSAAHEGDMSSEVTGSAAHEGEFELHMLQMVNLQSTGLRQSSRTIMPTERAMESGDPE
eukprot:15164535-Ditylum_brightwellii.AAC.1